MDCCADDSGMRLMVVEDDVALRTVLSAFFRSTDVEVLASAGDGQEALELLETLRPDLILTDCQMPRLDGISMVRTLRARGDLTPVIMMSGQHDSQVHELALATGVSQYLDKPLSLAGLGRAIRQTLAAAGGATNPSCKGGDPRIGFPTNHAGVAQW
jgi:CheY-like chemotaxis protein